jgi:hypothetical protein
MGSHAEWSRCNPPQRDFRRSAERKSRARRVMIVPLWGRNRISPSPLISPAAWRLIVFRLGERFAGWLRSDLGADRLLMHDVPSAVPVVCKVRRQHAPWRLGKGLRATTKAALLSGSHPPDRCEDGNLFRPKREVGEPQNIAGRRLMPYQSSCRIAAPKGQIDGELV